MPAICFSFSVIPAGKSLKRVVPPFAYHVAASHAAQFIVNLLGQLIERGRIARRPGFQKIGDFRVQEKSMTLMAAFSSPFRLYRWEGEQEVRMISSLNRGNL